MLRDEGVIEGVEVESGGGLLLAVGKRGGHRWERRRRRDDGGEKTWLWLVCTTLKDRLRRRRR